MELIETLTMDSLLLIIAGICILLIPAGVLAACKLHARCRKKTMKKISRISVVSVASTDRIRKKASIQVPSYDINSRPIQSGHHSSSEIAVTEQQDSDGPSGSKLVLDPMSRRISGCYLSELKLMDLGPMPRDQAVLEEERKKEQEKKAALI